MANSEHVENVQVKVEGQNANSRQHLILRKGRDLVQEIEKRVCGNALVDRVPKAEGYSYIGIRSAVLSLDQPTVESIPVQAKASMVVYLPLDRKLEELLQDQIVLVAKNHQEIVDHSLSAHRFSQFSNSPVFCLIPDELLESMNFAKVPEQKEIEFRLENQESASLPAVKGFDFDSEVESNLNSLEQKPDYPGEVFFRGVSESSSSEWSLCLDFLSLFKRLSFSPGLRVTQTQQGLSVSLERGEKSEILLLSDSTHSSRLDLPSTERPASLLYLNQQPNGVTAWQGLRRHLKTERIPEHYSLWSSSLMSGEAMEEYPRWFWIGGILKTLVETSGIEVSSELEIEDSLRNFYCPDQVKAVIGGFIETVALDADTLQSAAASDPFRTWTERTVPLLPDPPEKSCQDWKTFCWRFHLTGEKPDPELESVSRYEPAIAGELGDAELSDFFPWFLPDSINDESIPRPVVALLREVIQEAENEGDHFPILESHLKTLAEWAAQAFQSAGEAQDLQPVWRQMMDRVREYFDVSVEGQASLEREIELLEKKLPSSGRFAIFGPNAALEMFSWSVYCDRLPLRARFFEKIKESRSRLNEILLADDRQSLEAKSPDSLSRSLGQWGGNWIDPSALSRVLPRSQGSKGLPSERRERIEKASRELAHFLDLIRETPAFYLISTDRSLQVSGGTALYHLNPFDYASGVCDGLISSIVEGIRALRVAERELKGDPSSAEAMDRFLSHFDWQSLTEEELRLVPPILVVENSSRLSKSSLTSFTQLLRSGRPVSVCIQVDDSFDMDRLQDSTLTGMLPDYGYLGMAHREVFVLQATPVEPEHLLSGLRKLVQNLSPGVAVITAPSSENRKDSAWVTQKLAKKSRTYPCFLYDPSQGDSWADRFSLEGNETPEQTILMSSINAVESDQGYTVLEEGLTFAHVAALKSEFARHFWVIPNSAWNENQIPLADYLSEFKHTPPPEIPYIWFVDANKKLCRAIITRELAGACRDRIRSWRILQELGGVNNEYVQKAIAAVRLEMEATAADQRVEIEERARREGAETAINRLVTLFSDPSALPVPDTSTVPPSSEEISVPAATDSAETAAASSVAEPEPEEVEDEAEISEDPYIDSFLCSSCNDCINLNPLMFKYNSDNQAYIADPSAGTYLQLVKAAEACPARCIHPGTPRPDDETATPEVLERASAFQ